MSMNSVCPYCRTALDTENTAVLVCPGCVTPHHADCYEENGGCTVFGCTAAPASEPKMVVAGHELQAPIGYGTPPPPAAVSCVPPPPRMGAPAPPLPAAMFQTVGYGSYAYPPPVQPQGYAAASPLILPLSTRKRTTFVLLGVFLGAFGAHSFYAGSQKKAWLQLGITLLTLGTGAFMVWAWAVIDICTITTDEEGLQFES